MSESMLGFVSHGEEHAIPLVALYAALQDKDLRPDLLALADALAAAVEDWASSTFEGHGCGYTVGDHIRHCIDPKVNRMRALVIAYRAARQP